MLDLPVKTDSWPTLLALPEWEVDEELAELDLVAPGVTRQASLAEAARRSARGAMSGPRTCARFVAPMSISTT